MDFTMLLLAGPAFPAGVVPGIIAAHQQRYAKLCPKKSLKKGIPLFPSQGKHLKSC